MTLTLEVRYDTLLSNWKELFKMSSQPKLPVTNYSQFTNLCNTCTGILTLKIEDMRPCQWLPKHNMQLLLKILSFHVYRLWSSVSLCLYTWILVTITYSYLNSLVVNILSIITKTNKTKCLIFHCLQLICLSHLSFLYCLNCPGNHSEIYRNQNVICFHLRKSTSFSYYESIVTSKK